MFIHLERELTLIHLSAHNAKIRLSVIYKYLIIILRVLHIMTILKYLAKKKQLSLLYPFFNKSLKLMIIINDKSKCMKWQKLDATS